MGPLGGAHMTQIPHLPSKSVSAWQILICLAYTPSAWQILAVFRVSRAKPVWYAATKGPQCWCERHSLCPVPGYQKLKDLIYVVYINICICPRTPLYNIYLSLSLYIYIYVSIEKYSLIARFMKFTLPIRPNQCIHFKHCNNTRSILSVAIPQHSQ